VDSTGVSKEEVVDGVVAVAGFTGSCLGNDGIEAPANAHARVPPESDTTRPRNSTTILKASPAILGPDRCGSGMYPQLPTSD
jgi:hypothetical protein